MENYYDRELNNVETPVSHQNLLEILDSVNESTLGRCLQNSLSLGRELYAKGLDCDLMYGGYYTKDLNFAEEGVPKTIDEAESHPLPCVHFWIEIPTYDSGPLIVETASEMREYKGEKVIFKDRPERYMVFPNSRIKYQPSLKVSDFK